MCEREYVGCPSCDAAAANDSITYNIEQTEVIGYKLDDCGDPDYEKEPDYGEAQQASSGEYVCTCGWTGHSLRIDCIDEFCECAECSPPEYDEVVAGQEDEDAFVRLVNRPLDVSDLPHELQILAKDRCAWVALMPRWRSAEIYADWQHLVSVDYEPSSVCESDARELMPNYPAYDDREVCTA